LHQQQEKPPVKNNTPPARGRLFFWPTERVRGEVGSVRGPMILRILRDRLLGFFDGAEGADAELAADPLLDVVHQYPVTCCFSRSLGETKGHMKKKTHAKRAGR